MQVPLIKSKTFSLPFKLLKCQLWQFESVPFVGMVVIIKFGSVQFTTDISFVYGDKGIPT